MRSATTWPHWPYRHGCGEGGPVPSALSILVAWLVALLFVAELMRNTGTFTMADVLSFRLEQRPVRPAAATTTLAVGCFHLLAPMAGAGGLVSLLLGINDKVGQSVVIGLVIGLFAIVRGIGVSTVRSLTGFGAEEATDH